MCPLGLPFGLDPRKPTMLTLGAETMVCYERQLGHATGCTITGVLHSRLRQTTSRSQKRLFCYNLLLHKVLNFSVEKFNKSRGDGIGIRTRPACRQAGSKSHALLICHKKSEKKLYICRYNQ